MKAFVTSVFNSSGTEVTSLHEIIDAYKVFYPNLFSSGSIDFAMLFCTYSVYVYKISCYKLTSTRRDGGLFELLECVQPIRSRVWTIERFKTKTNDLNESWMKVGL